MGALVLRRGPGDLGGRESLEKEAMGPVLEETAAPHGKSELILGAG